MTAYCKKCKEAVGVTGTNPAFERVIKEFKKEHKKCKGGEKRWQYLNLKQNQKSKLLSI